MIPRIVRKLNGRGVILASGSPRRKEILQKVGFPFEVQPSVFEENLDKSSFENYWDYAVETSRGKAREVAERLKSESGWSIVVAADTIVVKGGEIMEKPITDTRASEMLHREDGLVEHSFKEMTEVTIAPLTDEIIEDYIRTREPLDKAGAYGIQSLGGTLVSSITGDYYNVVGLPLHRLCIELTNILSQ